MLKERVAAEQRGEVSKIPRNIFPRRHSYPVEADPMRFPIALILFFAFCLSTLTLPCRAEAPVKDIFIGSGTSGPFVLTWNAVGANTEIVAVNSVVQLRNLDYTLDAAAGTLTFTHPLPARAAVEATYETVPGVSQPQSKGQTIPLSVDLLRSRTAYFSLDALGKQSAGTENALSLGVGFGWRGGENTGVSSRFLYAPLTASSNGAKNADATGISLGGTASAGRWGQFSAGFSRADSGMDTSGANTDPGSGARLEAGRQILTLGGTLSPNKSISALLSFRQADSTDSSSGTAKNSETLSSLAVTLTPSDRTHVQADLAQTSLGSGNDTQTVALSLNTQANRTLNISAALSDKNRPGTALDSQTLRLQTLLAPSKTYSVLGAADLSRSGAARTEQQSVTLRLTPQPAVQLDAGVLLRRQSRTDSPDTVQTSEASVGAALHPLPILELSGRYKSRTGQTGAGTDSGLLDTSTARVALAPLPGVKVVGTYAQNPDDGQDLFRSTDAMQRGARRGLGLETSLGALCLSGGTDWSRAYGTPDVEQTLHADLGLRFSETTKLSLGYQARQNCLNRAVPLATAYSVGFTHTLGDRLSLSLSGKRRQDASTAPPDYNASASLGLKF